jgi:predicted component of type VI protein secretion system
VNISLTMVTAEGSTKDIPVVKLPLIIGRSAECRLRVPVDSVSRQHCELAEDEDEELVVRDLNSSNGTFVNRERVKVRELVPGDLLSIGPVVFVVRIDGHPKDIDPALAFASGAVAVGGGAEAMIDGVPTWSGGAMAPAQPAAAAAAPKPAVKPAPKDDDGFESLLKDLSESDFDVDLENPPPPGPKR